MAAKEETLPVAIRKETERVLISWMAPARPFKRRSRDFYITIVAIAIVFGLVLFFVEGWLPVILVISLVFLVYVMSSVEPESIEYKISNQGIKVAGKRTDWRAMTRFWFSKRLGVDLLVIETWKLPGRLEVVINPELKKEITKEISRFLPHEEVPPSFLDKASNWLSKKLPS